MPALHTVECDGFDRDVLSRLIARDPAIRATLDTASQFVPHADALLCDLFCALYKLNVELVPRRALSVAVLVNHRIMQGVLGSWNLDELRKRTELSEGECAIVLPSLVDRMLQALRREFRFDPDELLDRASVAQDEDRLAELEAQLEHLAAVPDGMFSARDERALRRDIEDDVSTLSAQLQQSRADQEALADALSASLDEAMSLRLAVLPEQLDDTAHQLASLGLSEGRGRRIEVWKRLQLSERLARSGKLQKLARSLGAFRQVAFEARRKRVARIPQELHEVGLGSDIERLLPSEFLGLLPHHRSLHLEFLRRFAEGELLEYELHGALTRGPVAICVDGSGSMSGAKELWAKAVALTLMECARRDRRRCLAIVFSAGCPLFEVELLGRVSARRGRALVLDDNVLDFAEHFPGGGTDFDTPLRRALGAVTAGDYRGGDIVLITDGFARVSDELIATVIKQRKKHRFHVRGILIDAADSSQLELMRFCDDVIRASDLAPDSLTELFASL